MKRYKLLKDLPTFNKGGTFRLTEHGHLMSEKDGVIAYAKSTLEKFNILLDSDWFEEIPEDYKRWRAGELESYYSLIGSGTIYEELEAHCPADDCRYSIGNYFKTEEEAKKAIEWLKAFTTLRDDTKGFKLNWKDGSQLRWGVEYNYDTNRLSVYLTFGVQAGIIFFATEADALESIKKHEREWLIFFGVEE